jgi:hypothetical protein
MEYFKNGKTDPFALQIEMIRKVKVFSMTKTGVIGGAFPFILR